MYITLAYQAPLSRSFLAWTDYPFAHLGDAAGQRAPLRRVEVIEYDRDKYVRVRAGEEIVEIKRFYLYRQPDSPYDGRKTTDRDIRRLSISRSKLLRLRRQANSRQRTGHVL